MSSATVGAGEVSRGKLGVVGEISGAAGEISGGESGDAFDVSIGDPGDIHHAPHPIINKDINKNVALKIINIVILCKTVACFRIPSLP